MPLTFREVPCGGSQTHLKLCLRLRTERHFRENLTSTGARSFHLALEINKGCTTEIAEAPENCPFMSPCSLCAPW